MMLSLPSFFSSSIVYPCIISYTVEAPGRAGVPGAGGWPARRTVQETESGAHRNGEVRGGAQDGAPPTAEGAPRRCTHFLQDQSIMEQR